MADYTKTTWVDDDGSGTTGTDFTAARMNNIEDGIVDAIAHNRIGALSSRPAAAAGNKNWLWIATDTDGTGGLYRSDGTAWTKMLVGSLTANNTRFGVGGALQSGAADNAMMRSNYNPVTDRLIDTSKSAWSIGAGDTVDQIAFYRAPATAGSPAWVNVFTLPGDGTNLAQFLAKRITLGIGGLLYSDFVDNTVFACNFDHLNNKLIDATKTAWEFVVGGTGDQLQAWRAPANPGSPNAAPAWSQKLAIDSAGKVTVFGDVGVGSGGLIRSPTVDNAGLYSNYNAVTDRLINTSKTGWQIVAGAGGDVSSIYRAPATVGSPAWVNVFNVASDGRLTAPGWTAGQLVTSLPTTGPGGGALVDGQECYYLADAATGTVWHLKYRAAEAGSFKWYYVGGSGLLSTVDAAQSTSSLSYVDLTTAGPSITVPLAGDYTMEMSAVCAGTGGANRCFVTPKKNALGVTDTDGSETSVAGGSTNTANAYRRKKLTGVAANDVFKLQYANLNATAVAYGYRALKMTPIRVG